MIELSNVTKRYGDVAVVDNVSVRLAEHGMTALIGPNGAGKSTLLGLMSRLQKPDSGRITVDGLDVQATPGEVLARKLAILRQENRIATRLSVYDLVGFGRYPYSKGRPTREDHHRVREALDFLELNALAERYLDELSGGQRQRAYIAMVLCQDTDYILLDEPLNNLDMKHAVAIMKLLRRAADAMGKKVIVVLHDINFAACYADDILALQQGRLVRRGSPDELMCPDVMHGLYGIDMTVQRIRGRPIGFYYL